MLSGGRVGTAVLKVSEVPLGQPAHQLDVPNKHHKYDVLQGEHLEGQEVDTHAASWFCSRKSLNSIGQLSMSSVLF